jgi:hypothetical protein
MKKKSNFSSIYPEVGMGVTVFVGSDRHPGTIIQVTQNGKRIVFQRDIYKRTDNNGMSEYQTYELSPDPNGVIEIATLRKDGKYRITGGQTPVHVGSREAYYDFSF